MKTPIKIASAILFLSLVTFYFFSSDKNSPHVSVDSLPPIIEPTKQPTNAEELNTEMAILTVPREAIKSPPEEITDETDIIHQVESSFSGIARRSDEAKKILEDAGLLPSDLAEESYLEFDLESLRSLEKGDTFDFEIPQTSETFSTEVTQTNSFPNGDKSIFGRLVGSDGEFHNSVMTVGEDALYGQITTPSGNYVFESKGKHGWLAAKRDLYKSHIELEAVRETNEGNEGVVFSEPQNN